jgi:hypothetical protein
VAAIVLTSFASAPSFFASLPFHPFFSVKKEASELMRENYEALLEEEEMTVDRRRVP